MDISQELNSISIYLRPTYSVIMKTPNSQRNPLTDAQRENMKNLERNKPDGVISQKARTRLLNSVNWLIASAKKKFIWCKETKRRYSFKINFITLTLPTTDHDISDHFFKKKLMHAFINTCRYRYGLKNFVWKVEAQANGNIHAHFTTDSFMPHQGVRRVWNRILQKNGLLEKYQTKHQKMSEIDYIIAYSNGGKVDEKLLRERYKKGVESNWSNPNSTDVKAVHKIADIGGYLAKYLSKNDDDRRKIKGRIWGCSYIISRANKLSFEIPVDVDSKILNSLNSDILRYKELKQKDKITNKEFTIASLYFYELQDWGKKIKGILYEKFNEMLFNIRHSIDIDALRSYVEDTNKGFSDVHNDPKQPSQSDQLKLVLNL